MVVSHQLDDKNVQGIALLPCGCRTWDMSIFCPGIRHYALPVSNFSFPTCQDCERGTPAWRERKGGLESGWQYIGKP